MDHVSSGETCLNFMTVGSLRRKLATDPDLRGVNVIVLDELHERDKLTDFLLMSPRALALTVTTQLLATSALHSKCWLYQSTFGCV